MSHDVRLLNLKLINLCHRIKQYEEQLSQVQGALKADPSNEELVNLEGELKNLIALTKQILGHEAAAGASSSAPSTSQSASSGHAPPKPSSQKRALESESPSLSQVQQQQGFAAGDDVQAKYNVSEREMQPALRPFFQASKLTKGLPNRLMGDGIQQG